MFSIIIPLFNKAPYIKRALNSIISQNYPEYEIIIIDDGSTDDGVNFVNQFFKSNSNYRCKWKLISQQNKGVSSARNLGVSIAENEFIAFLDADDWWAPDYLLNMKSLINHFPDSGIYGSSYYIVKHKVVTQALIGIEGGFKQGIIDYFKVYAKTRWMPIWTGAAIVRKSVFELMNGFKPKLKLGEDFDLWTRIALKYPVAFLNKPLAYYNQDVDQKSRAIGQKLYLPNEHVLFQNYSYIENPDFKFLFQRLALYGLLPYYAAGKNLMEMQKIFNGIDWRSHELKYKLIYKILPRFIYVIYFKFQFFGSKLKALLKTKL